MRLELDLGGLDIGGMFECVVWMLFTRSFSWLRVMGGRCMNSEYCIESHFIWS